MSDYCRCKDCKHCNSSETSGYKCYCEWYKTYEDPDIQKKCQHFEK